MLRDEEMLEHIYRNAGRSCDCIKSVLPEVTDDELREQLKMQLGGYESFATVAGEILKDKGVKVRRRKGQGCSSVDVEISPAQAVVSNITDELEKLTGYIKDYRESNYDRDIVDLANDAAYFNQKNIDRMKPFC